MHHEVEYGHASTGGNQNRIRGCTCPIGTQDPATQPQRVWPIRGGIRIGLYGGIIECFGIAGRTRCLHKVDFFYARLASMQEVR